MFIDFELECPAHIKLITENLLFCPYQVKASFELFSDYMDSVKHSNNGPETK